MKTNAATTYRDIARAKRASEKLHEVELPSGAIWKLRTPPVEQFITAGKLPASLAAKMAGFAKKQQGKPIDKATELEILSKLTPEESMANITFGRDLLLFCAVEPEISLNPDPGDENQIAPEEILPEDFVFLINWVLTGGKSGQDLDTFRRERSEHLVAGPDGQGIRTETVEAD